MRRAGGSHGPEGARDGGGSQLVVVAVDADKSSQHALKWAADHLISRAQIFVLLHVRRKPTTVFTPSGNKVPISEVEKSVAFAFLEQIDQQTKELLLPFQCFCSRRGLQCKEFILDETDISKAIVDFVNNQFVDKLVLGASSRNALSRTFRSDVPTSVSKAAPDFCSIYVISKGKVLSSRPAIHPNIHPTRQLKFETSGSQFQSVKSEPVAGHSTEVSGRSSKSVGAKTEQDGEIRLCGVQDNGMSDSISKSSQAEMSLDHSYYSTASCPSPSRAIIDRRSSFYPQDYLDSALQSFLSQVQIENSYPNKQMKGLELNRDGTTICSDGSSFSSFELPSAFLQGHGRTSWSHKSMEDTESEMRRVKLELMKAMDMYNNACQEVFNAKQQARAHMANENVSVGELRLGEQAKIDLAEIEKERCKVLLEAAQAAQRQKIMEIDDKISGDDKLFQDTSQMRKVFNAQPTSAHCRMYTIEEIREATNNFSDNLKIGEGGYGPVFKASLDHTIVAIKILRPGTAQGAKQFQQEIEVLSCIRHPNMVLLLGACPEYGCLVYEYMANGSLEDCLFSRSKNTTPLPWQLRFKIAAEIATGLLFLHQTKPEPLVHRDLKPGNILLDHNFVSKIADVGLARLVPSSTADAVTQYHMTAAAGTFCYIDPEYQQTGMLGTKSDIYALGIILLQLVTAAQPMGLAHNVEIAMEAGKFERILDPSVPDWPMEDTLAFTKLALRCAELRKKDRPDLATVMLPELNRLRYMAEMTPINSTTYHHRCSSYQPVAGLPSTAGGSSISGMVNYMSHNRDLSSM